MVMGIDTSGAEFQSLPAVHCCEALQAKTRNYAGSCGCEVLELGTIVAGLRVAPCVSMQSRLLKVGFGKQKRAGAFQHFGNTTA
jgi:hypothetical protein